MILKETLKELVKSQKQDLFLEKNLVKRNIVTEKINVISSHASILTGIRRCGKSTLLKQLIHTTKVACYFNFEDPRGFNFEADDFPRLEEVFLEDGGKNRTYFLDEIQNIPGWELWVRNLVDRKSKVVLTGSSSRLLSIELGAKLTGRHLDYELFPFSYKERLQCLKQKSGQKSFDEYFANGGFPEYTRNRNPEILRQLFQDILSRDILVRYGIKDIRALRELAVFLFSNIGKEFSYNELTKILGFGSVNTVASYISFMEDCYLVFTLPKFSFSYKKQMVNPKKIYAIDNGMINAISVSASEDKGRLLENLVFLQLRKNFKNVFYFKNKRECDFVAGNSNHPTEIIQVCYELNEMNKGRELEGLTEAMDFLKVKNGKIITYKQKDRLKNIDVVPAIEFID